MERRRTRLTARSRERRSVSNPSIPYPGTVNQPDRKFKEDDKYDIDWETVNHPFPDMRHEWQDNPRDEIGFGIPKQSTLSVASVRVAANKAVRMAVLLLGDKVGDDVIEDQARDLMAIGGEAMDRSLARFAESQSLYEAADEKEEEAEDKAAKTMQEEGEEKAKKESSEDEPEPKQAMDDDNDNGDDGDDDDEEGMSKKKKSSDELVDKTGGTKPSTEVPEPAVGDGDKSASDESEPKQAMDDDNGDDKDDDEEGMSKKSSEESEPEPKKAEETPINGGANEMDIELGTGIDDILAADTEADAQLASLFEDDEAIQAAELEKNGGIVAAEKAGIKTLGGPARRVASGGGGDGDISDLWESAPDVSHVFE